MMLLLRKAHLGEVSVTVWPKILKEMCAKKNIFVLEYPARGDILKLTSGLIGPNEHFPLV